MDYRDKCEKKHNKRITKKMIKDKREKRKNFDTGGKTK